MERTRPKTGPLKHERSSFASPMVMSPLGSKVGTVRRGLHMRNGDQNWLYVAQDGKLFRRPVKVTGANAWTVTKPPKPTL
jgi:hypothetical protein